ncbi:hypothetical protein RB195_026156 [Necator americanus]
MREELHITATSLERNEIYEIYLRLHHFMGTFMGSGIFRANELGEIDLTRMAPIRGTYTGIRPMGLFEGMLPCEDFRYGDYFKCTPPNPLKCEIELRNRTGKVLYSLPIIKRWMHPDVIRREIDEDGLCGTLFKPPGDGPFPTILDICGTGGGLNEQKGATLSAEGFCVLSLAFFQYKTLIEDLNDLDMNYFKKAIHWLIALPFTKNEIGIQGVSLGGLLVNMLAVRNPEIVAVCSINGTHILGETTKIKENGVDLPYGETPVEKIYFLNQTLCNDRAVKEMTYTEDADIKVETAPKRTAFRYVASLDDLSTPSIFVTRLHEKKLKDTGHYVEVDFAPGGHLMEPPYFPSQPFVYAKFTGCYHAYGGEPCLHGASQNKIWPNTIAFFKRFLGETKPLPDYSTTNEAPRSHL